MIDFLVATGLGLASVGLIIAIFNLIRVRRKLRDPARANSVHARDVFTGQRKVSGAQEPVGRDFVTWVKPGVCPDCGYDRFSKGPTGGMCENIQCMACREKFNICQMPGLTIIQRI